MTLKSLVLRVICLGLIDAIAIRLAVAFGQHISILLGAGIAVFTLVLNIVFFDDRLAPWRWVMPALAGMALLIGYPIGYSVSVAFTNYGDGHLLEKEQVIQQRLAETYAPPNASTYDMYIFRSDAQDAFRFWLVDEEGHTYLYAPGDEQMRPVVPDDPSFGARDENGVPLSIDGFGRLPEGGALRFSRTLETLSIPAPPNQIRLTRLSLAEVQTARAVQPRWSYDAEADTLTNRETGVVYRNERGNFVAGEGSTRDVLVPGFPAYVGLDNFLRVVQDPDVRGPFWRVFLWTLVFASGSVVSTLALGLAFAELLHSRDMPLRPLFRSIYIIPYAVPGWLMIVTWRGLLNPVYGPVNLGIEQIFGVSPQWFSDPVLSKIVVLFVNMYLGFPYMMLISLGVMQSIPPELYEAATMDGASAWQRFRWITLPVLLVAMAPLLVASFAFNFNNFTVIELVNYGGPPMGAGTVAGHTDILLSYTYRLAFAGSTGTDYGFAAAIGFFIFLIIGPITFFNFRRLGRFEEVMA